MTRMRVLLVLGFVVAMVLSLAAPASAGPVENLYNKLLGCEGMIQWPCPGPVIW